MLGERVGARRLHELGLVNRVAAPGAALEEAMAMAERLNERAPNALASIKTVAAYGELFNSAYWASRPYRGDEQGIADGCLALAEYLTKDDRSGVFRRLA